MNLYVAFLASFVSFLRGSISRTARHSLFATFIFVFLCKEPNIFYTFDVNEEK